ncbi:MAG: zinc ribbon domain-containing protein, partial [Selenomonadales bacterium]|nr:zinc ribbon domain-containing protein [Selenomonadales bacterium]
WMRVQARLRNNTRNASNNAKVPYLLSGKLFCGACGAAFVANSTSNKGSIWRYYICGERNRKRSCDMPRVRKEEIEEEVIDMIANFFDIDVESAISDLELMFANMKEPDSVVIARKELVKIEKSIKGIVEAFKQGAVHQAMIDELNRLKEEEQRYKAQCNYKREIPTREELREFIMLGIDIKKKSKEEQKRIIDMVVDKIYIYKDKPPKVDWKVRLNSSQNKGKGKDIRSPSDPPRLHHRYAKFTTNIPRKSR